MPSGCAIKPGWIAGSSMLPIGGKLWLPGLLEGPSASTPATTQPHAASRPNPCNRLGASKAAPQLTAAHTPALRGTAARLPH